MGRIKTVIFDFDGTIVDTLSFYLSVLHKLEPTLEKEIFKQGIETFKDLGLKTLLKKYRISYAKLLYLTWLGQGMVRKQLDQVKPFPGMVGLINELWKRNYAIYVLSSNSKDAIQSVFSRYNISMPSLNISTDRLLFNKSRKLNGLLSRYKLDRTATIYVGDEIRDVEACKKSAVPIIAVAWGFNSKKGLQEAGADYIADTPEQILEIVQHS